MPPRKSAGDESPYKENGPMIADLDTRTKHARYVLTPWLVQGDLQMESIERAEGVYLDDETGKR